MLVAEKLEAVALSSVISATANPVTASEKVNVAVNAAVLVAGTSEIATVGAVLSTTQVLSFVPVGVVFERAFAAVEVSAMSWPLTIDSVTVALRLARSPPDAVTSYTIEAVASVTAVTVAIVPAMAKSVASTFFTFSLNVTRQVRLSSFVGEDVGVWRTMDATLGAVVSTV